MFLKQVIYAIIHMLKTSSDSVNIYFFSDKMC